MLAELPDVSQSDAHNAACLSVWSSIAYGHEHETRPGVYVIPWASANARGVVACVDPKNVVVAIAGTDDVEDWRNDVDISTVRLGDFARACGIYNYSGHGRCLVHEGFAAYANLSLSAALESVYLSDFDNIWFVGHSLGGAAAVIARWLLPITLARRCRVVTFGAPGTHRGRFCGPCFGEPVLRVNRVTDPVPVFPVGFRHAAARQLWIRYRGSVRNRLTLAGRAYRAAFVAAGALSWPLNRLGYKPRLLPESAHVGHQMSAYMFDLEPLR